MPNGLHILVAEKSSFSEKGLRALAQIAPTDALDLTQEQLLEQIVGYTVLVVRLGLRVDDAVLAAGRQLRVVATPTTGLDHIDLAAAERRGITVLSLKGERAFLDQVYATAEHTFALLLSLIRCIPVAFEAAKGYEWRRDLYRGTELHGKTLGLIGCGRLGTMVARYGTAFGMQVMAYDPYQPVLPEDVERCALLTDLLSRSDVISLHVPLNDQTRGMLSDAEFTHLRPGTVLVNTSRGAVIDEAGLLEALRSGRLAGAALDVLCNEHMVRTGATNPLIEYARNHGNLLFTPHIAGATYESVEKADLFIVGKLSAFVDAHCRISGGSM